MFFKINKSKIIHEIIEGEAVIVNLDSGTYYSLDKIGAEIWDSIENGADLTGIPKMLAQRYTGAFEEIEKSVFRLIKDLEKEGLIEREREAGSENFSEEKETGVESKAEKMIFVPPVLHKYTDMQELLLLDPIHEVDESGWPNIKPDVPPQGK